MGGFSPCSSVQKSRFFPRDTGSPGLVRSPATPRSPRGVSVQTASSSAALPRTSVFGIEAAHLPGVRKDTVPDTTSLAPRLLCRAPLPPFPRLPGVPQDAGPPQWAASSLWGSACACTGPGSVRERVWERACTCMGAWACCARTPVDVGVSRLQLCGGSPLTAPAGRAGARGLTPALARSPAPRSLGRAARTGPRLDSSRRVAGSETGSLTLVLCLRDVCPPGRLWVVPSSSIRCGHLFA